VVRQGSASGDVLPGVLALEAHQHTYQYPDILKTSFQQKFKPKYVSKCIFFWKKAVKLPQRPGLRPRTPVGLRRLGTPPPDPRVVTLTYWYRFVEARF